MPDFYWDENKRQKTLKERGLDFADAHKVFADDYALSAPDPRYDSDQRWLLIGTLNDELVIIIAYIELTSDIYRIISMRKAEKSEIKRYQQEKLKRLPSANDPLIKLLEKLEQQQKPRS